MTAWLTLDVNDDDYVPRFLAEVRKVMQAAHALQGKEKLSDKERVTLSKAIRLQAVLLSEDSLDLYIAHVLTEGPRLPTLEESEDLQTPVKEALLSLSQSALGLSTLLGRISGLGLEVGIEPETIESITEVIAELARQVAALEPPEGA